MSRPRGCAQCSDGQYALGLCVRHYHQARRALGPASRAGVAAWLLRLCGELRRLGDRVDQVETTARLALAQMRASGWAADPSTPAAPPEPSTGKETSDPAAHRGA